MHSRGHLFNFGDWPSNPLAESLGVGKGDEGLVSDRSGRTNVDGLYVVGWSTPKKIQAIISAETAHVLPLIFCLPAPVRICTILT